MIRVLLSLLLLVPVFVLADQYDRSITVENETGYSLVEFYGSNIDQDDWEEDILDGDPVPPFGSVDIDMDDGSGHCLFDLKAVFSDGDEVEEYDFDVCKLGTFTITGS